MKAKLSWFRAKNGVIYLNMRSNQKEVVDQVSLNLSADRFYELLSGARDLASSVKLGVFGGDSESANSFGRHVDEAVKAFAKIGTDVLALPYGDEIEFDFGQFFDGFGQGLADAIEGKKEETQH